MKKKIAALIIILSLAFSVISATKHLQHHNQELSLKSYLGIFHILKKNTETNECAAIQKEISFYSVGCKKINTSEIISNNSKAKYSGIFELKGILYVLTSDGNLYTKSDGGFHFLKKLDLLNQL